MNMSYPDRLSTAVIESLLPELTGVYLHGSLALDDFIASQSDVDLCAVVSELREDSRRRLVAAIGPDPFSHEESGFDLHIVTLDAARTAGRAPLREMWVAVHRGWEFQVHGPAADQDMCLTFEMCRLHGRVLWGPNAGEIFAPADRVDLLAASERELAEWLSYDGIVRWDSGVLTACRAWWLVEEGEIGSKTSAGQWALSKGFNVVEQALAFRGGRPVPTPDQEDVRGLLLHIQALLRDGMEESAALRSSS